MEQSNQLQLSEELLDQLSSSRDNKYTVEDKINTCALWALGESSRELGKKLGIPDTTIRWWMRQPWWRELLSQIRKAQNEEFDAKLSGIMNKSLDALKDRVENGNFKVNPKTGELERVPMSSSELAKDGIGIPFDKRALTRGDPTNRTESRSTDSKQMLRELAESFMQIARESDPRNITNDVDKLDN